MTVGQMLAHVAVPYEYEFMPEKYGPPAKGFKRSIMRLLLKSMVAGPKPYKKNSRTASDFLITETKEFEFERDRLIEYLRKTQQLGVDHFVAKPSHSLGSLTSEEWNNMFFKHLDYHLKQFGV